MRDLRKGIRDYLVLRRSLGFKLVKHEAGLEEFASFLERKRSAHITSELALERQHYRHIISPASGRAADDRARLRPILERCGSGDGSSAFGPVAIRPARARPYFYSDREIQQLLRAAKARPSCDPLRCCDPL